MTGAGRRVRVRRAPVRSGSVPHWSPGDTGGHQRSRLVRRTARHRTFMSRTSAAGAWQKRVRIPQSTAAGLPPLPTRQASPGTHSPCGQVDTHTGMPYERRPRRPCHYRAIHSSPDRSPADTHGQCHGCLKLRRSLPPQGRLRPNWLCKQEVAGSNLAVPTISYGCLADGTTHKRAVLPIL
jgi:hypothetical protein